MEETLLFTRKYNGKEYKFYISKGVGCLGIYSEYVSVETPENGLGYPDYVLFSRGEPYTLHRYLQPWIKQKIKETLLKHGYEYAMQ